MVNNTLNRDDIIGADVEIKIIEVPEWNGAVYVKRRSIRERDFLIPLNQKFLSVVPPKKEGGKPTFTIKKGDEAQAAYNEFRLKSVGFALCDKNGKRLFNDDEIEPILGQKSPAAIERIFNELGNVFKEDEA
jgi:hypothetical protein